MLNDQLINNKQLSFFQIDARIGVMRNRKTFFEQIFFALKFLFTFKARYKKREGRICKQRGKIFFRNFLGLPPNTKVKFELEKSSNDFLIMKEKTDPAKYQIKITNIALYVPVAQLSSSVFNELSTIMSRKNEPHAISIHYRRIEIRPIGLPKNKEEYYSESLFSDCDLPCRIVICFVETSHKNGTQTRCSI